ncbi:helix-turn-helix domain-containing protein [Halomarina salina]|uniref:Helix-turn-helix domain-containing protein n=1 Tax=Halomarina salina TaxID=1872699 RepID=A0ABD5RK85_9EURY|nr:helix-turn-helix domain-containing protein [Halomarina salina]
MPRRDDPPGLETVLDALDDPACRALVRAADGSRTASELAADADVPLSTAYRKLDRLTEASLLETETEVRTDGHHTTRYRLAFEEVTITLDDGRTFTVDVIRPPQAPSERLETMWTEVRREA